MKFTKAQRLFMKAGAANHKLRAYEASFKPFCDAAKSVPSAWDVVTREIKTLRHRRKKLIREALEAWRDMELDNFLKGYNACKDDEIL